MTSAPPAEVEMTPPNSAPWEDTRPIWVFRNLIAGEEADEVLDAAREVGRAERWGHAARIPLWTQPDEIIVVAEGTVVAERAAGSDFTRLTRGDAFGKSLQKRAGATELSSRADHVTAHQETTIYIIARDELDQIWQESKKRRVLAGSWRRKQEIQVPVLPLLGALPTSRLARILLHLVETYGELEANKGRLPLTLRASQLAELSGLSRRRAAQAWKLFERAGLLTIEGKSLLLMNINELRRYALG